VIDIDVASSQIDLGIVQGFTSYVTNVTGVLQANFKVTGSGYDPHLDGAIDIKGGAFSAPLLGMSYTGLDTRIDFKPDAVTISQFQILDDDKNPLTVGGSLAVHERAVGAVDIKLQSDNFKVIKNSTADLKFDSDVHVTGTVRTPKVEGTIEVGPSTINVAELLETATTSAYSTTATEISPAESAGPEPTTPAVPGIFDSTELRVSLAIPGDLLIRGNNIKPANAPIDVGDMNAYVGGAVNIVKPPHERIRIAGEVNTVRGGYTFQGRRFDILRDGRIRFQGSDVIDPVIDLQARRIIAGVEVFVHVRGTMRQPELSFTSNPPQDEADLLSLIIFNTPINELGEGQQVALAARAQALAGGYLASGLSQSIASALSLDEFEIQAAGDRGIAPSITIGQQLGKDLFVRLRQGFGNEQATEFILEYQLAQYLRLQGTASDVSGSTQRDAFRRVERGGLDLIFFFSY
jgi:autotransporter translocation and assembly factor TamB